MKESRVKSRELSIPKLVICYLLLPLLLFTVHCSLFTDSAEAQVAGKITRVEGRVDILRAGADRAVPLNVGDAVNVGDIVRTKSDGVAEITFIDNSVMDVGPRSRLGIEEYLYKPEEGKRASSLRLYRGRTGFQIPRPTYPAEGSKFEMKTRTAVAGVRGTEGILYTDGVERVYVREGLIEFTNPAGTVMVAAGRVGEIFYGQAPIERSFTQREYEQQQRQITPAPPAEAPPADVPPPVAAPPVPIVVAAPPPPPLGLEPPLPPTDAALPHTRVFTASANILMGEIMWFSPPTDGLGAVIQSGSISGIFNQTILEGGFYALDMSGSYAWVAGMSEAPHYGVKATDDWFYFFYSGSADGRPFYGASVGEILWDPADPYHVHPDRLWDGVNMGWIEDGPTKYWYIGDLLGIYTNPIFNDTSTPISTSGTFSAISDGLFWDGSRPFWEQLSKIIPTLPHAIEFFVPITETAVRIFDISFDAGQLLTIDNMAGTNIGSVNVAPGLAGKGIELTPGSGLFDVNVNGSWSVSAGNDITNLWAIYGTISGDTTIGTNFTMEVDGGVEAIDSNTAIVGAHVGPSGAPDPSGVMIGKMTGSTSGTFEAKAVGEMNHGFMLP
jgi:hypothetical protein